MDFVTGAFATWLLEQIVDAGRKRLTTFFLGDEQERAVQAAASGAIRLTAAKFCPPGSAAEQHLAMVIDQVFAASVPAESSIGEATLLEALHVGIADQLTVLDDFALTGTGQSSAELLGVAGKELAEQLARHLVQEIVSRGARGGPLATLANQLNHDLTHLQGQSLEAKLDRLTSDVENTLRERQQASQVGQYQVDGSLGRLIPSWSALELEVHRPIVVDGAPTDIPEYIERKHDRQIRDCLADKLPKLIVSIRKCCESARRGSRGQRLRHAGRGA